VPVERVPVGRMLTELTERVPTKSIDRERRPRASVILLTFASFCGERPCRFQVCGGMLGDDKT
jgi:hypothetical protein